MKVHDLATPALLVDVHAFDRNVDRMAQRWPGPSLRPHVKAFKSTALAHRLAEAGHRAFCCATVKEVAGMAAAGLGEDLLLANECLDLSRLTPIVKAGRADITVAVDSPETIRAAALARVPQVLIDVEVGLPRCGCDPADAGRLADLARSQGLEVRGVMGYEGHLMREPGDTKAELVERSMALLRQAHAEVGGDVVSGGGTGTWDVNTWVTELQAGSYCLMDTEYTPHAPGFENALYALGTVISRSPKGWAVLDTGLKAFGMDHGDPTVVEAGDCWFVSDEHLTFGVAEGVDVKVGDRVRVLPAHVDPTISQHERLHLVDGDDVLEVWDVDLRHW
ncbi:MAG TPA: alanine racemase [Acidimicrobiales bacterium]|nr:alanine racemase [Acidimicrobiales bacterium]